MTAPKARLFVAALTLAQFRSHALTHLALDGRPVALFGPNGAGKTNILEAVSLLSPGRGLRRASAEDLPRKAAVRPDPGLWRIRATLQGPDGLAEIALEGGPDGRRRVAVDGKAQPQTALARIAPMLWLTPAMDRLWIEGPEGRRRFIDRAALSFSPGHADAASAYEKAMRARNRLLREPRPDPAWLDALEAQMAQAGAALAAGREAAVMRLNAAQRDVKSLFPHAEIAMIDGMENAPDHPCPTEARAEASRRALARNRREDAAAGRALTGPHRADLSACDAARGVEARLCSTGEQKALLISLVLANARALGAEGAAPILLLDEVAAHLDADRRAALFDELFDLGAQAWMTGTGPELFEGQRDRAQMFNVRELDGASVTTRPALDQP
ncbi:DNA replication/repair protein RecF [Rubrimonas sp.]|uniref:DNA replication/repair protein RecF n=1 Tax=Rubrimonas sp. TaxID=2036015 RepID=UPI002FDC7BED